MTPKRVKRQATDWEKCFAKHIFGKGLVSKIYREILKLSNKKNTNNPIKKWARSGQQPKISRWNKHMKRCLTSMPLGNYKLKQ